MPSVGMVDPRWTPPPPKYDAEAAAAKARADSERMIFEKAKADALSSMSNGGPDYALISSATNPQELQNILLSIRGRPAASSGGGGGGSTSTYAAASSGMDDYEANRLAGIRAAEAENQRALAEANTRAQVREQAKVDFPEQLSQLTALRSAVTPAAVAAPAYVDDKQASDLAFARAKDKAGLLALSRMSGLKTRAQQMGMTGGGQELRAADSILGDTQSGLAEMATAQAGQEATRANQYADRNYAGAIQQRGQDMSLTPSLLSLVRRSGAAY